MMNLMMTAGGKVRLKAGTEELLLEADAGDLRVGGVAGVNPILITFSEYLGEEDPPTLMFVRAHEVFDLEYTSQSQLGLPDRTLVAHGLRLMDASLVEVKDLTVGMAYTFRAERLSGNMFSFLTIDW